jgi:hypothetical protein
VLASGLAFAAQEGNGEDVKPRHPVHERLEKFHKRLRDLERRMADREGALDRIEKQLDRLLEGRAPKAEAKGDGVVERFQRQFDELRERWGGGLEGERFGRGWPMRPRAFALAKRPWLGVYIDEVPAEAREEGKLARGSGVYVTRVVPGSPADKAGLMPRDIIVRFSGIEVRGPEGLVREVRERKVGEEVEVVYLRGGRERRAAVTLEPRKLIVDPFGADLEKLLPDDALREWKEQMGGAIRGWRSAGGGGIVKSAVTAGELTVSVSVEGAAVQLSSRMSRQLRLTPDQRRRVRKLFGKARAELSTIVEEAARTAASGDGAFNFGKLEKKIDALEARAAKKLAEILNDVQLETYRRERKFAPPRSVRVERHKATAAPAGGAPPKVDLEFF